MQKFEYKCVAILGAGERTTRILNEYARGWLGVGRHVVCLVILQAALGLTGPEDGRVNVRPAATITAEPGANKTLATK